MKVNYKGTESMYESSVYTKARFAPNWSEQSSSVKYIERLDCIVHPTSAKSGYSNTIWHHNTYIINSMMMLYIAILVCLVGCDNNPERRHEWFFVENAELMESDIQKECRRQILAGRYFPREWMNLILTGHRIKEGSGLVIGYRSFTKPTGNQSFLPSYLKLTIYLNKKSLIWIDSSLVWNVPRDESESIVIRSWANAPMPTSYGCIGYARSGTVTLKRLNSSKMKVSLDLEFEMRGKCKYSFELTTEGMARLRPMNQLTPWEGKVDGKISSEAFVIEKKAYRESFPEKHWDDMEPYSE